jgi:protein-tyrosine phosphatase
MRDQVDSDITLFLYTSIEFIERALAETKGHGKILVHCFKVSKQIDRLQHKTYSL